MQSGTCRNRSVMVDFEKIDRDISRLKIRILEATRFLEKVDNLEELQNREIEYENLIVEFEKLLVKKLILKNQYYNYKKRA